MTRPCSELERVHRYPIHFLFARARWFGRRRRFALCQRIARKWLNYIREREQVLPHLEFEKIEFHPKEKNDDPKLYRRLLKQGTRRRRK